MKISVLSNKNCILKYYFHDDNNVMQQTMCIKMCGLSTAEIYYLIPKFLHMADRRFNFS